MIVSAAWLPLSIVLLILIFRTRSRAVLLVGAVSDLVMLATAQALLHQGISFTSCYPIIAAFAAYTCPEVPTWALGGFTLALSLSVQSQLPSGQRFTAAHFGLFAALVIGVLLIVERATTRSRGAEQRFAQAQTRADVVLDAVGSAVVVTDSASRVLTANPAADRALHSERPLQGQLCRDVLRLHVGERRLDCRDGCQLLALSRSHGTEPTRPRYRRAGERRRQPQRPRLRGLAPGSGRRPPAAAGQREPAAGGRRPRRRGRAQHSRHQPAEAGRRGQDPLPGNGVT